MDSMPQRLCQGQQSSQNSQRNKGHGGNTSTWFFCDLPIWCPETLGMNSKGKMDLTARLSWCESYTWADVLSICGGLEGEGTKDRTPCLCAIVALGREQTSRKATARSLRTKLERPVVKAFAGINKRKRLFVSGVPAASGSPPLHPGIISGEV